MGAKKGTSGGAATFDPEWLDAGPDRARSLVDQAGERCAALVDAWVARKNVLAVLEVASDDGAPTPARKAARRGINVLKSRGVAIPERTRVATISASDDVVEAWFRAPDGAGTSAFTLGSRSRGRYDLADVIVKRGTGLVSIAGMQMSRSQLRTTFDGIAERFGSPPAPIPVEWARARIAEARRENDRTGSPVPLGFDSHRELLGPAPDPAPPHPAADLPRSEMREAMDRSAKLHAEPEVRGWLPEPPAIQKMLIEIGERIRDSAGEPGTAQTKVREVIEKATDRHFSREVRVEMADRMLDAAISMAARGASDRAGDLVAMADAIRSLDADAPHTVPFLRAFFEKAFGLATARAARQGI